MSIPNMHARFGLLLRSHFIICAILPVLSHPVGVIHRLRCSVWLQLLNVFGNLHAALHAEPTNRFLGVGLELFVTRLRVPRLRVPWYMLLELGDWFDGATRRDKDIQSDIRIRSVSSKGCCAMHCGWPWAEKEKVNTGG